MIAQLLTGRALSQIIWEQRYRLSDAVDAELSMTETWRRVAHSVAKAEGPWAGGWSERFLEVLKDFRFLPAGRILAGAGSDREVSLFNCFVMGPIEDTIEGIFGSLRDSMTTLQQGGGVGFDFSTVRPRNLRVRGTRAWTPGVIEYLRLWDVAAGTFRPSRHREAAMMGSLRCDHPDLEDFITAKSEPGRLTHFNLSVQVTDAFMAAVEADAQWPLVFPIQPEDHSEDVLLHVWSGSQKLVPCRESRRVGARALWSSICRSAAETGEPGVLFVDRINQANNLWYDETLSTTNPCGELPLPAFGACVLGSLNLSAFIREPFSDQAQLDWEQLEQTTRVGVRFLDDVIDITRFPLPAQRVQALRTRRIGLGITGLADALLMLGLRYGSDEGRALATRVVTQVRDAAYDASIELAQKKGVFPAFDPDRFLAGKYIARLPAALREGIRRHGLRNSQLLAIAPAGSISLLAGNVSSGIEPVFSGRVQRQLRDGRVVAIDDSAVERWRAIGGSTQLPPGFTTAHELGVADHVAMQAALQPLVDGAIAKTINLPPSAGAAEVDAVYRQAWASGLKGCTVFKNNPTTGGVLLPEDGCGRTAVA